MESSFKDKKILIVEDNHISFKLIEAYLKRIDVSFVHAVDGYEALKMFNEHPDLDMILMDIQMPGMDGLEVTRKIRTSNAEIPIIATTANVFPEDREESKDAGCTDFLAKPIHYQKLYDLLQEYFSK